MDNAHTYEDVLLTTRLSLTQASAVGLAGRVSACRRSAAPWPVEAGERQTRPARRFRGGAAASVPLPLTATLSPVDSLSVLTRTVSSSARRPLCCTVQTTGPCIPKMYQKTKKGPLAGPNRPTAHGRETKKKKKQGNKKNKTNKARLVAFHLVQIDGPSTVPSRKKRDAGLPPLGDRLSLKRLRLPKDPIFLILSLVRFIKSLNDFFI